MRIIKKEEDLYTNNLFPPSSSYHRPISKRPYSSHNLTQIEKVMSLGKTKLQSTKIIERTNSLTVLLYCSIASTALISLVVVPLAYYVVLPPLLAHLPKKAQFVSKLVVVLISTLIMSIVGCFVAIVFAVLNKRHAINYVVSRFFSYLAAYPCGVTFKISGKENLKTSPAIVVCNHQSSMDMMVLGTVFPTHCVVMAKRELLYFPFLGLYSAFFFVVILELL